MTALPPDRMAAAAKRQVQLAQAEYERASAEFAKLGDSADLVDVDGLDRYERARDDAAEQWRSCAPAGPAEWWPGGWRFRRWHDGKIEYGVPVKPWATRDEALAAIGGATARQPLLHNAVPVWIAVDQADAGAVALDADYWRSQ